MNALVRAARNILRGPRVSALLGIFGIESRRYWLLVDVFGAVSERGEMLGELGRNGVALKTATLGYAVLSVFLGIVLLIAALAPSTYMSAFLFLTAFLVSTTLLVEAGNSLVSPAEGLMLAHQPINGATYSAAKLTHLGRIVLYLVPSINAVPAVAGLFLPRARWWYPFVHLSAALALGIVAALCCCAFYGWLIRLLPVRRLRAAAQLAGVIPFIALSFSGQFWQFVSALRRVAVGVPPGLLWAAGLALSAAAAGLMVLGIRSLSADYAIRISGMTHRKGQARSRPRRSRMGDFVARLFGGQPARAGFEFVRRMTLRDFQFRRQVALVAVIGIIDLARSVASGWRTDPLSGRFTTMHLFPHLIGVLLLFACTFLPYGSDFKGARIFQSSPSQAFGGFARGVYAALGFQLILLPHVLVLLLFAWPWGLLHAALFTAYSATISCIYLAFELRLIDGVPFSRQADAARSALSMPLLAGCGLVIAAAVGIQYYFVFRSPLVVYAVTFCLALIAFPLTRHSLGVFEGAMRYNLGLLSVESGTLYVEV